MKKIKLKGKAILRHLTGISCPVGGVSWSPPVDDQDKARRLLVFLADRRALYQPYDMEVGPYVVQSVLKIRQRLTSDVEELVTDSPLKESIRAMRAACRKFLDETQGDPTRHRHRSEPIILSNLGELRAFFGIHISRIACAYDLVLEPELTAMLPADPAEEDAGERPDDGNEDEQG